MVFSFELGKIFDAGAAWSLVSKGWETWDPPTFHALV
jgi:hypothetical protein